MLFGKSEKIVKIKLFNFKPSVIEHVFKTMTDELTVLCENCGTYFANMEEYCPTCGEINPFLVEDFAEDDENNADILENGGVLPNEYKSSPRYIKYIGAGCTIFIIFLSFIIGGIFIGAIEGFNALGGDVQGNDALPTKIIVEQSTELVDEDIFDEAKLYTQQGEWEKALESLLMLRQTKPNFQPSLVSEAIYVAYYELGLRLVSQKRFIEALQSYDEALVERPNDPVVMTEWEKVSLYISLKKLSPATYAENVIILEQIYTLDQNFADVQINLRDNYIGLAELLASENDWCNAHNYYQAANNIMPSPTLDNLITDAVAKCDEPIQTTGLPGTPTVHRNPTPTNVSTEIFTPTLEGTSIPTPKLTSISNVYTPSPTDTHADSPRRAGRIFFSRFNPDSRLWEIVAISLHDGSEQVMPVNGLQPAVNITGKNLAYVSSIDNSKGIHVYSLISGEDTRATTFSEDILPNWGKGSLEFAFASQRSGDRRWEIFIGFSDGKGDPTPLGAGRTPDMSSNNTLVAYQGTDMQGNNPGIYISTRGSNSQRLTTGESDRSPMFSPNDGFIAYMSTNSGNWDVWLIPTQGGLPTQITLHPSNDGLPTWSPDGTQLAFVSDRDGSWGIYIVNANGGMAEKMVDWDMTNRESWLIGQISWGR
ncbi:MAG: hypothetical protein B6242_10345 [Anaerolineaceae bacterium 4572_78]|nr:MAG: hypothetical protein B6242_10345 [Anaerolineaceae bacterium 4572_78]